MALGARRCRQACKIESQAYWVRRSNNFWRPWSCHLVGGSTLEWAAVPFGQGEAEQPPSLVSNYGQRKCRETETRAGFWVVQRRHLHIGPVGIVYTQKDLRNFQGFKIRGRCLRCLPAIPPLFGTVPQYQAPKESLYKATVSPSEVANANASNSSWVSGLS